MGWLFNRSKRKMDEHTAQVNRMIDISLDVMRHYSINFEAARPNDEGWTYLYEPLREFMSSRNLNDIVPAWILRYSPSGRIHWFNSDHDFSRYLLGVCATLCEAHSGPSAFILFDGQVSMPDPYND